MLIIQKPGANDNVFNTFTKAASLVSTTQVVLEIVSYDIKRHADYRLQGTVR